MKKNRKLKKIILFWIAAALFTVVATIFIDIETKKRSVWRPNYKKQDLSKIVSKEKLKTDDYELIINQTGLGRTAVDSLFKKLPVALERKKILKQVQDNFFSPKNYQTAKIGLITFEEKNINENKSSAQRFKMASIQNGDIIITKSTQSLGWRHGHAAIVIDAEHGKTLEATVWGTNTSKQSIDKWQNYSTFIILRLKNRSEFTTDKIIKFAEKNLYDIPYGLLTGLPQKSPQKIIKTQCAHLIWYLYYQFGFDLDSNGSWLVTPKDIVNSDLLEVVQLYGVDPKHIWY